MNDIKEKDDVIAILFDKLLKQKLTEITTQLYSEYILVPKSRLKELVKFTKTKKSINDFNQTFIIGELHLKNEIIMDERNYDYFEEDYYTELVERQILNNLERFLSGEKK